MRFQKKTLLMNKPERILIIRLKSIGDVLHTLPAVHAVRKNYPDAHISYLVCKSNALLLEGFSSIDDVLTLDRAAMKKNPLKALPILTTLFQRIRRAGYDLVIDMQGYGETAWLTRLSGAADRWGSVYKEGRRSAYTKGITRIDQIHVIDWNLQLLEACGLNIENPDNTFDLPETYLEKARERFIHYGLDPEKPTLMIQPFTSTDQKNWTFESYLAVAEHFRKKGIQVFFCGGPADREGLAPAEQAGFPIAAGEPLLVVGGMIKLSKLVLGGDTGILHIATALQRHVVMLMRGQTGPGSSIPYAHRDWVIDTTGYENIKHIPTERVITACAEAI